MKQEGLLTIWHLNALPLKKTDLSTSPYGRQARDKNSCIYFIWSSIHWLLFTAWSSIKWSLLFGGPGWLYANIWICCMFAFCYECVLLHILDQHLIKTLRQPTKLNCELFSLVVFLIECYILKDMLYKTTDISGRIWEKCLSEIMHKTCGNICFWWNGAAAKCEHLITSVKS